MATFSSTGFPRRVRVRATLAAALAALVLGAHACSRVPLLAPSGSAITLQAVANATSTEPVTVVALVIEGATGTTPPSGSGGNSGSTTTTTTGGGTPVHNGTHVTFTSTFGQVVPSDATTVNGRATVTFVGGQAGKVTITATSGAATKTIDITLADPPGGAGGL